jgi:pimeloyl-ACP methyl ester carboxylesterase
LTLPVYRSFALDTPNRAIDRAVVVLHGSSRNAHKYFPRMTRVAAEDGLENRTLIVAPRFRLADDDRPEGNRGNVVYWDKNKEWKRGDLSSGALPARIGSFAAMDALLRALGRRRLFPNLAKLTVIGHSGGGQFMQRYVVGQPPLPELSGVKVRYIVTNPARYMYLNEFRPAPVFDGNFAIPATAACPRYNEYEYGLDAPNAYMAAADKAAMINRARERDVVLLLGEADNDPRHKGLTRNCRANYQGRDRLERGRLYKAHLDRFFAPHNTRVVIVPGVGHSSARMFKSTQGRRAIFF